MNNLNFRVKVIWLWTKLSGEKKYFSLQAKSSEDVCYQNQIVLKQNQVLRVKFSPAEFEAIKPFADILLNNEIEISVNPEFTLIEADGYTVKQFSANAIRCVSSMA